MEIFGRKIWWALTAAWATTIFSLSGPSCSSASSASLISVVFGWLSLSVLPHDIGLMNSLLRKSAHLTEYAIFAMILYHSIKPADEQSWSRRAAFGALLASGMYSLTDEFHQIFVPGRHASLFDCLIDTTGAFLGLLVLSSVIFALRRHQADTTPQTAD